MAFDIQTAFLVLPCLLLGCTVHEYAHAYVAKLGGDHTAEYYGRLTLNPIKHIDPIGTLIIPILSIFLVGVPLLAWAKPVPVNPNNFKKPSWDILVSLAGPASNVVLFLLIVLVLKVLNLSGILVQFPEGIATFFLLLLQINVVMAVFNLMPFPPLDGSHIVYHYFVRNNYNLRQYWDKFQQYSFIILLLLIQLPPLQKLLSLLYQIPMSFAFKIIG